MNHSKIRTGVELTDAELATVTGGQSAPGSTPTVTVLPYLLANTPQITIVERFVLPLPPSCNCTSLFGSLLGGGFGQVISEAVISSLEPLITAGTINIMLALQASEVAAFVADMAEVGILLL